MRSFMLRFGCAVAAFVGLSGFDDEPKMPPEYSPNYTYVDVEAPDGRLKHVLVPDACMAEEEEEPMAKMGERRLPPGCANAFNLQRMVERRQDLVKGRAMGRAPVTPAARAAVRYQNGPEQAQAPLTTAPAQPLTASGTGKE